MPYSDTNPHLEFLYRAKTCGRLTASRAEELASQSVHGELFSSSVDGKEACHSVH